MTIGSSVYLAPFAALLPDIVPLDQRGIAGGFSGLFASLGSLAGGFVGIMM